MLVFLISLVVNKSHDKTDDEEMIGTVLRETSPLLLLVFFRGFVDCKGILDTSHKFQSVDVTFNVLLSAQIAFSMFGVYVMLDDRNVLDAQKVFVSMALINILKTPLSQLPFAISTTMQVSNILF